MRPIVPVALLCLVATACGDAFSPSRNYASVSVEPVFTRAAAEAYPSLVGDIDNLRFRLERSSGALAGDRTVSLALGADSVVLEMIVTIVTPPQERLTAVLELRAGDLVLFSGSRDVMAVAGSTVTALPITLDVAGPIEGPLGAALHAWSHPVTARTAKTLFRK